MTQLIHYLIRHPNEPGSLIYPSELEEENYVGYGAYYFIGDAGQEIAGEYLIHAIKNEEIVTIKLEPVAKTKTIYRAKIDNIGAFEFKAILLKNSPLYIGSQTSLQGKAAIRVLKPKNPNDLNKAVENHNFYFVGYSPRIDDRNIG